MRLAHIASIIIIAASFAISLYFYPQLPNSIATHWDAQGNVNGYMPKFMGVFFVPALSLVLFLVFLAVPKIDPRKKNIEKFRPAYDGFIAFIMLFMLLLHMQSILWNLGLQINMMISVSIGIGALFICTGMLLKKAKMNWFIGIRTPWTLSNEKVWNKTHKIGSKLFIASGIIALFGLAMQQYAIWLILVPVILSTIFLFAYSYVQYQKIGKNK
jgi:uncharacterized membrane protein